MTRNEKIEPVTVNISNSHELEEYFADNVTFEYGKGDLEYFLSIYNNISNNQEALLHQLRRIVIDERSISRLAQVIITSALAELLYMNIHAQLLIIEYTKLLNNFSEHDANKFIKNLVMLDLKNS